MELFKLFTKGFIEEIAGALDKDEIRYLPLGVKVITCELAMRFLTDYINGDVYFKTNFPEHNLIRARAQMDNNMPVALVPSMNFTPRFSYSPRR